MYIHFNKMWIVNNILLYNLMFLLYTISGTFPHVIKYVPKTRFLIVAWNPNLRIKYTFRLLIIYHHYKKMLSWTSLYLSLWTYLWLVLYDKFQEAVLLSGKVRTFSKLPPRKFLPIYTVTKNVWLSPFPHSLANTSYYFFLFIWQFKTHMESLSPSCFVHVL